MNKLFFLIIFSLIICFLSAESFPPKLYLSGVPVIANNEIDLYKNNNTLINELNKAYFAQDIKTDYHYELDYDNQIVKISITVNNVESIYPPVYITFDNYIQNIFKQKFSEKLEQKRLNKLQEEDRSSGSGIIKDIVIKLPKIAMPKAVRKFMGPQAARLSLDGSQKLTIGGTSTFKKGAGIFEGQSNQPFQLDMRQDLTLRLNGTIGRKIHVSVNHQSSSEDQFTQPSEVNISYRGDDDEIIQSIEGGNIALALSGSRYISQTMSSEGVFGIKSELELGNLKMTAIMGKDEAKKNTQSFTGSAKADSVIFASKDFAPRTHYFINDPHLLYETYSQADAGTVPDGWINNALKTSIDNTYTGWIVVGDDLLPSDDHSLNLYLDDGQSANNNNSTINGVEIGSAETETPYNFDLLRENEDYNVDYNAGIIILKRTISNTYTLGITYTQRDGTQIGSDLPNSEGNIEVKLLRRRNQNISEDPDTWMLQVRNIYSLGISNVKNEGFDLSIFTYNENDNTLNYNVPDSLVSGIPNINTYNDYLSFRFASEHCSRHRL